MQGSIATDARPLVRSMIMRAICGAFASGKFTMSVAPVSVKLSRRIRTPAMLASRTFTSARSEKVTVMVASRTATISTSLPVRRQAAAVPP